MLIYVAASRPAVPGPDLVLVGAAIHEGDEAAVRATIGDGTPDPEVLRELVSSGSAGRVARELASLIGASYAGRSLLPEIAQRISDPGKPSGWVHYTLKPDCPCPGCGARRLVAAAPSRQPTRLRPPRYGVRLE